MTKRKRAATETNAALIQRARIHLARAQGLLFRAQAFGLAVGCEAVITASEESHNLGKKVDWEAAFSSAYERV